MLLSLSFMNPSVTKFDFNHTTNANRFRVNRCRLMIDDLLNLLLRIASPLELLQSQM